MNLSDYYNDWLALSTKRNLKGQEALDAVSVDGYMLRYVAAEDQTEEICLAATDSYGFPLRYVCNQTEAVIKNAVQKNGTAIKYAILRTEEICQMAAEEDADAVQYFCISPQFVEPCRTSIRWSGGYLSYLIEQPEILCMEGCSQDGFNLQYVRNQTILIAETAVAENINALKYVEERLFLI